MIRACACCKDLFEHTTPHEMTACYCDRCEVAWLEFKLALLEGIYHALARGTDEA
jgi:hypothetical protein